MMMLNQWVIIGQHRTECSGLVINMDCYEVAAQNLEAGGNPFADYCFHLRIVSQVAIILVFIVVFPCQMSHDILTKVHYMISMHFY